MTHLIPIFALATLCAAWGAVQLLARRLGTKNHIDHPGTCCGACGERGCKVGENK